MQEEQDVESNEAEVSEFGAGIVVCLAKFSEHLTELGIEGDWGEW